MRGVTAAFVLPLLLVLGAGVYHYISERDEGKNGKSATELKSSSAGSIIPLAEKAIVEEDGSTKDEQVEEKGQDDFVEVSAEGGVAEDGPDGPKAVALLESSDAAAAADAFGFNASAVQSTDSDGGDGDQAIEEKSLISPLESSGQTRKIEYEDKVSWTEEDFEGGRDKVSWTGEDFAGDAVYYVGKVFKTTNRGYVVTPVCSSWYDSELDKFFSSIQHEAQILHPPYSDYKIFSDDEFTDWCS